MVRKVGGPEAPATHSVYAQNAGESSENPRVSAEFRCFFDVSSSVRSRESRRLHTGLAGPDPAKLLMGRTFFEARAPPEPARHVNGTMAPPLRVVDAG